MDIPPTPVADTSAPSVPLNLLASYSSVSSAQISWTASTDNIAVSGYRIYRNGGILGSSSINSYTDSEITLSEPYCYSVSAIDAAGNESEKCPESCLKDVTPPSAPADLKIISSTLSSDLSWAASSDNIAVTGYKIFKNGVYLTSVTSTSFSDTDIAAKSQCCFAVSAFDAQGNESRKSNQTCFNSSAGKTKWIFETEAPVLSSVAIGRDGTIYAVDERNLYAINPDGSLKWKYSPLWGEKLVYYENPPVIAPDGSIYVRTANYIIVRNSDGTGKWGFPVDGSGGSPAIRPDGTVFVTTGYYFSAINPDGSLKWKKESSGTTTSISQDGTIYSQNVTSLSALKQDGTLKWIFHHINLSSPPSIGMDGVVFYKHNIPNPMLNSDTDKGLSAINADGTLKWFNNSVIFEETPVINAEGVLHIASEDGYLNALNPDGSFKWRSYIGNSFKSSLTIGFDGAIYGMTDDKCLSAFDPEGKIKWKCYTGSSVSSPAIASDGTIYVGTSDNTIFAIQSESLGLALSSWPRVRKDNTNNACLIQ